MNIAAFSPRRPSPGGEGRRPQGAPDASRDARVQGLVPGVPGNELGENHRQDHTGPKGVQGLQVAGERANDGPIR